MSSSKGVSNPSAAAPPALPPNVAIFSPKDPAAAKALTSGSVFTRLTVSASIEPAQLSKALEGSISESWCLVHRNVVLIFDNDQDAHHEHFRAVCLALKDADIGLDVAGCIFDATEVVKAGFQLDTMSSGSVLVVDIMDGDDDDDDSDDDDAEASLGLLMKGDSGATIS
ncbi:hypothetical protein CPLU01_14357 [Colletotrichum plurivorum]|uniref:Uncharacterized protein n=1 Tax=Colletotrichum plurivorum TaxID=2175906 RepID=A0A8H6N044_9PEZI|nr:hypothetical protein CPLU01_14357 [Colletotrichum plurivorum]